MALRAEGEGDRRRTSFPELPHRISPRQSIVHPRSSTRRSCIAARRQTIVTRHTFVRAAKSNSPSQGLRVLTAQPPSDDRPPSKLGHLPEPRSSAQIRARATSRYNPQVLPLPPVAAIDHGQQDRFGPAPVSWPCPVSQKRPQTDPHLGSPTCA